jgi:hypothetical protein
MPARDELPSTLERSPKKAQETWIKTHDAAVDEYGEGERAHRTAYASLKHSFEKVGDHWEPKDEPGPSDPRAARGGKAAREGRARPLAARTSTATRRMSCTSARAQARDQRPIQHEQEGARPRDRPQARLTERRRIHLVTRARDSRRLSCCLPTT